MSFTTGHRIAPFLIEQVETAITNFLADGPDDEVVGECVAANRCVVARAVDLDHLSPFHASACQGYIGFYDSLSDDGSEQYRVYCNRHVQELIAKFDGLRDEGFFPTRTRVRQLWQEICGGF